MRTIGKHLTRECLKESVEGPVVGKLQPTHNVVNGGGCVSDLLYESPIRNCLAVETSGVTRSSRKHLRVSLLPGGLFIAMNLIFKRCDYVLSFTSLANTL